MKGFSGIERKEREFDIRESGAYSNVQQRKPRFPRFSFLGKPVMHLGGPSTTTEVGEPGPVQDKLAIWMLRGMTCISPHTAGRDASVWATRSSRGLSSVCMLGLRDSMGTESDSGYEGIKDLKIQYSLAAIAHRNETSVLNL